MHADIHLTLHRLADAERAAADRTGAAAHAAHLPARAGAVRVRLGLTLVAFGQKLAGEPATGRTGRPALV
ncbi:hypothetical protein [Streptomyces sp. NPDC090025]|uniref:hypothetical protein n=1 Tax=Streptomyces sp. NPDC090025 TaxID=3365922 RepID=UPI003838F648